MAKVKWRLRELAEPKGFTAYSLAREMKMPYPTIKPIWDNKAKRIDATTLQRLAEFLEVQPGELIGTEEEIVGPVLARLSRRRQALAGA